MHATSIDGVTITDLLPRADHRGSLTMVYRRGDGPELPQWNLVRSAANVLRGCHAHLDYDEYYVPMSGPMFFALADIRPDSPTYRARMTLCWDERDQVLVVPRGVLHGVYCEAPSILAYGLTAPYTGSGEFTCRWDDADLGVAWPTAAPLQSDQDRNAATFRTLLADFGAAWSRR